MHIGLFAAVGNALQADDYVRVLGSAAEERGFHSLWAGEHAVLFDEYQSRYPYAADGRIPVSGEAGLIDPFALLAFLAAATRTMRLGTAVCLVPQRNPVYTAKEVAAVDFLSGGRFEFGVGIGWLAEEFHALAAPFERRAARCRSYLEVMKRCWCDPVSQYEDEFYALPRCRLYPKPIQQPHPPISFGGESDAALKRVADLGQGWFPFSIAPDALATRRRDLERLLAVRGRSIGDIAITVCPYLRPVDFDAVQRYRDAGADQVVVLVFATGRDDLLVALDHLAESIVEPARRL